jgi:lactate dehydrogenase-like 2-hydroxyacid dehydrogenase
VSTKDICIAVPGPMYSHAVDRITNTFRIVPLEKSDAALLQPDMAARIRGIAVVGTSMGIDARFVDALPELEIVANFGVGYDSVDAKYCAQRGVMVTNTPDVLTEEVADTAVGLLINTVRELPKAEAWLRAGKWVSEGNYPLTPATLRGRHAGIFGMDRIGSAIARRLEGFGLKISYHNRRKVEGVSYDYYPSLKELATAVDTLISVAPGGPLTNRIMNAEIFRALGPDGVFVNIGRGSTVDEPALIAALKDGTIRAAGLDVFADEPRVPEELLTLPNACLTPHVASASVHTRRAMADLTVDNLVSWFTQRKAITPVPETVSVVARQAP